MRAEPKLPSPVDLGVLRARGADVVSFLQGQLSQDLARLQPEVSLLAGYHNPQGRVIALLRLLLLAPDDVLLLLPRELGGVDGPEPTRFGDWEKNGRCIDF